MPEGLARAVGAGVAVKFGGEDLILDPPTYEDLGICGNELRKRRKSPQQVVAEFLADPNMSEELKEKLVEQAYQDARRDDAVPLDELIGWLETFEGITFLFWLKFHQRYPDKFTQRQVEQILSETMQHDPAAFDGLRQARDLAAGVDDWSKPPGRPRRRGRRRR